MKFVCIYDMAPGAMERVMEHFPGHRARLDDYHARGELLAAGPLGSPPEGAMAIFTSQEAAESFVAEDPFVTAGLVANWKILPWKAAFL